MGPRDYCEMEKYADSVARMDPDVLTEHLERKCAGDIDARNAIVEAYMHIVFMLSAKFKGGTARADAISCGIEELIDAIDRFDPSRVSGKIPMDKELVGRLIKWLRMPMVLAARNSQSLATLTRSQWTFLKKRPDFSEAETLSRSYAQSDEVEERGVYDSGFDGVDNTIDTGVVVKSALAGLRKAKRAYPAHGSPELDVEAMVMYYGINCPAMTASEIADVMGITSAGVYKRVYRAMDAARKEQGVDNA